MLQGLDVYSTYKDPAQHLMATAIGSTVVDYLDDLDRHVPEV